jgi:hypothetical protein
LHFRTGAISETFEYDARRRFSNQTKIDAWGFHIFGVDVHHQAQLVPTEREYLVSWRGDFGSARDAEKPKAQVYKLRRIHVMSPYLKM